MISAAGRTSCNRPAAWPAGLLCTSRRPAARAAARLRPSEAGSLCESCDVERAERLERIARQPMRFDAEIPGLEDKRLGDAIEDPNAASAFEQLDDSLIKRAIGETLTRLPERDRQILEWRFGLEGQEAQTLESIGRRLGLSRERVRQLEARALAQLRENDPRLAAIAAETDAPSA